MERDVEALLAEAVRLDIEASIAKSRANAATQLFIEAYSPRDRRWMVPFKQEFARQTLARESARAQPPEDRHGD